MTDEVKKSISKSNRVIAENILDTTISAFNIPKIFDQNYKGKMATAYFIHGLVSAKVNGTLDDILSHLNNMEILKDKVPKSVKLEMIMEEKIFDEKAFENVPTEFNNGNMMLEMIRICVL